jgi:hypothetical protein
VDQVCQDAMLNSHKTSFLKDHFELISRIALRVKFVMGDACASKIDGDIYCV